MSLFDEIKCEDLLNNFPIKESAKNKKKKNHWAEKSRARGDVKSLRSERVLTYDNTLFLKNSTLFFSDTINLCYCMPFR